jgi:putative addiction module component (TIGR02574 family)
MAARSADEFVDLPVQERLELIDAIWESIRANPDDLPVSEEVRTEMERRLALHRADPDAAEDLDVVLARLRAKG